MVGPDGSGGAGTGVGRRRPRADGVGQALEAAFEQAPEIAAILKPDGSILRLNRAARAFSGLTAAEASSRHFAATPWCGPAPEARQRILDALARAATGQAADYEVELSGAGGPATPFAFVVQPLTDRAGRITRLLVQGRDVTMRQRVEAALRRSEAELRRAQRVARLHHWHWTAELTGSGWRLPPTQYSPGTEEIFGVPAGELDRSDAIYVDSFVHPEDRARVRQALRDLLDGTSQGYGIDYRVIRPDGEERVVYEMAETETLQGGRIKMTSGTIQDVTELRRTAEALRRSEQSLANAQRIARLGSFRWDAATDRIDWSREAFRILGLDPDTVSPSYQLFLSRVHPDDRKRVAAAVEDSRRRAGSYSIGYRVVLDDGSMRDVQETNETVCASDGSITCINGTIQDVTERKREEAVLRRAKEQAEVASQSKSQFLANMSHELRTPLNAIIGFSEVMAGEMLGPLGAPKYAAYARDILSSGRHLLDVINDILEMSRIEAGAVRLNETLVDLDPLAGAALRLVEQRAAEIGLALANEVSRDLPQVLCDERLIRQAAINLLSNAVKFTPAGGRVALRAGQAPDGGIWLAVADTGIGIAAESLPTALEPFGQVDSSLSRRYEGTGLGLPLVKSIIELHQGRLAIDSVPGAGTTVTMWLPPARTARRPAAAPGPEPCSGPSCLPV